MILLDPHEQIDERYPIIEKILDYKNIVCKSLNTRDIVSL